MDYGSLAGDSVKRSAQLKTYNSVAKRYPSSLLLLGYIWQNNSTYTKQKLEKLLGSFDTTAKQTALGKVLCKYAADKQQQNILPNLNLKDINGAAHPLYTNARLNMIVVWASWCGHCLAELTDLKALNIQFAGKGLNMTSVSVDEDMGAWNASLLKNNAPVDTIVCRCFRETKL